MADEDHAQRIAALEEEVRALRVFEAAPYRSVVEDMTELVVRWKPDGTRIFVNDAYCRMFGAARETLIGTSFWPLVSDADRAQVQERIRRLSPEHPISTGRHRVAAAGEKTLWMEWCDRALFDARGNVTECQSVGRDITLRMELEDNIRRIEQADAVFRASASIAHDLGNVLMVISSVVGAARIASDRISPGELEAASRAVDEAQALLDQLRGLRYGRPFQPVEVDLSKRVSELIDVLRELAGESAVIVPRCSADPCRILGDPTQIGQVLLNLVRNSAEASRSCRIELATESLPGTALHAGHEWASGPPARCSVLRVSDDAGGIPAAILASMFDPGVTAKPSGKGLGLATVKLVVAGHDGSIRVDTSSAGTTFEIAFPSA